MGISGKFENILRQNDGFALLIYGKKIENSVFLCLTGVLVVCIIVLV